MPGAKAEIYGPVLQVVRWDGNPEDIIAQINARAAAVHVGNIYINST